MTKKNIGQNGFGIIEVLVSAMIIVMVVGAAVGLERAMVKRNVETSEKIQAYNLVREGLEIGRAYRDTVWINGEVDDWNTDFPNDGVVFYFSENNDGSFSIVTSTSGEQIINQDSIEYSRKYEFKNLNDLTIEELNMIVDSDNLYEYDLSEEIKVLNVSVSWNQDNNVVEASTFLTDWKPQI